MKPRELLVSEFQQVSAWKEEQGLRRPDLLSRGYCGPPWESQCSPKGRPGDMRSSLELRERETDVRAEKGPPHPPCPQAGAPK